MTFGQAMGLLIFSSGIGAVGGVWVGVYMTRNITERALLKVAEQETLLITAMRKTMETMTAMLEAAGKL